MSRRTKVVADDWVETEAKVPEETATVYVPKGAKNIVVATGKGKKKKMVTLRIPSALFPELKRYVNAEFWTAETLDDPATGASQYSIFTSIVQGSAATNRNGDMIRIKNVVLRFYLLPSTSLTNTTVEIAVVRDKEPATGVPGYTTIWQGGLANVKGYHAAVPNYDKRTRFDIMRMEHCAMDWAAAYYNAAAIVSVKPITLMMDLPVNKVVRYDGTGARPYSGSELEVFGWSDVSSNTPQAFASLEVFFVDA